MTKLETEVFINHASINNLLGLLFIFLNVIEEVRVKANLDAFKHLFDELRIAANWNALIAIVEIVVVVGKTNRQALNNVGRQIFAITMPLLFGVALDELFVDTTANERNCLLFEILRLTTGHFLALFINTFFSIFWRENIRPNFAKRIHIERHVVNLVADACNWRICIAVEFDEGVYKIPNIFVVSMKNMGAIFMNINALDVFGINIAGDVVAFIDN